jgi:hypothetical protein
MAKLGDIARESPEQPESGAPEDWERIEEALGYKDADPELRERFYRDLLLISHLCFGPGARMPEVRAGHVSSALAVLRGHAAALQAYLWHGGRPRKVERFEDLLEPPADPPEPPDDGLGELDRWAMFYIGSELLPAEKQQTLLDGLAELIAAVDAAKKALPEDRGGRPRNRQLHSMIYELAEYYARHTGRKAGLSRDPTTGKPSGPFFRFVSTVLRVFVPDQVRPDDALYSEIRRTLRIKHWQPVLPWPLCSLLSTKTPIMG